MPGDDAQREAEKKRLVIRVYTNPPQPVFARVRLANQTDYRAEHQFFFASGAYTGYFDRIEEVHLTNKLVTFDLFSVPDLKQDKHKVEFALPPPGTDYDWPKRIAP